MKIIKIIKNSPFKSPFKQYYIGTIKYGTPYMLPRKFISTIFKISKELPKYKRNKSFKLFGYHISYGSPIYIHTNDLAWKDKFNSPRFEWCPAFILYFFKFQFCILYKSPPKPNGEHDDDKYYEMILKWLYYNDKDIDLTEKNWNWVNSTTKKSTWDDFYLKYNKVQIRTNIINDIIK